MELDIAILTGCDGRLQRKRDLRVNVTWLSRRETGCRCRVHVSRVELGHHDAIGPGGVCNAKPENAVLEACGSVDGRPPVERLITLLVGVAVAPVDNLLSWDGLFPYEVEVAVIPIFL